MGYVKDAVGAVDLIRQRRAGFFGGKLKIRNDQMEGKTVSHRFFDVVIVAVFSDGAYQPAEKSRSDVVRMAFHGDGHVEEFRFIQRAAAEGIGADESADDAGRGGTESSADRHIGFCVQIEAAGRIMHLFKNLLHGFIHQVGFALVFAGNAADGELAVVFCLKSEGVVEIKGHAEGVKSGADVR